MAEQIKAVRGVKDILPDEIGVWRAVEQVAFSVLEGFGFEEIRVPIIEELGLFERSVGTFTDIVQKEMYVFKDKKGRTLALRPEATASVVRAFLEHQLYLKKRITRLYYSGAMFRYDRPQKGRYRQFHQIGAEIFGGAGGNYDGELIVAIVRILERMKISGFTVELNSVGCPECKAKYGAELKKFFSERSQKFCHDCRTRAQHNILRVLDCKVESCKSVLAHAPIMSEILCAECLGHMNEVIAYLASIGVSVRTNPHLVRGLDYYTKTVFEVKVENDENAVAGGGRYDNLVQQLGGPSTPAAGFAIGMERICAVVAVQEMKKPAISAVFLGEKALRDGTPLINALRSRGIKIAADYDDRPLKSQLKTADKEGTRYVLILGENELERREFLFKDMKSGSQQFVSFDSIEQFLKGLIDAADAHMR